MLGSVNCNWGSRRVPVLAGVTVLVIGVIAIGVFFSRTVTVTGYPSSSQVRSDTDTQYGEPFWVDEFDGRAGSRPNDQYWRTEIGNYDQEGWGNNELQFYTDSAVNSSLNGEGQLLILAREAPAGEKLSCWGGDTCSYTSARLTTEGTVSIRYGRVDVLASLPTGQGLLPAIWMLGDNGETWPAQGEIDIAEVVGGEPSTVYGTVHGPGYFNEKGVGATADLDDKASDGFHLYSVVKEPNKITWLVDDEPYFTVTPQELPDAQAWVFEQEMHLLLNVAVGGDWPGNPDGSTVLPAMMVIDFVRMYGEGEVGGNHVRSENKWS